MKVEIVMLTIPLLFVGILFQFMPLLTRRGIFFSATVAAGFPQSSDGRRMLRSYRLQAALWTAFALVLTFLLVPVRPEYGALVPTLLLLVGSGYSYWLKFREIHDRYGEARPEIRQAELSVPASGESFRPWLWVLPFLALALTAVYLHAHWSQLPASFPVHWGPEGQPNRWASRDWQGVYGPLMMGAGMNVFLLGLAWLFARLSRKTVMRRVTVRMTELLLYPVTFTFILVALLPLVRLPLWLGPAVMAVSIAAVLYWSYRQISAPASADAVPEPQSDSYWKAGIFYFNPNDPAIFVAKRVGIGYTMNFANKWAWIFVVVVIAASIFFGRHR